MQISYAVTLSVGELALCMCFYYGEEEELVTVMISLVSVGRHVRRNQSIARQVP